MTPRGCRELTGEKVSMFHSYNTILLEQDFIVKEFELMSAEADREV